TNTPNQLSCRTGLGQASSGTQHGQSMHSANLSGLMLIYRQVRLGGLSRLCGHGSLLGKPAAAPQSMMAASITYSSVQVAHWPSHSSTETESLGGVVPI